MANTDRTNIFRGSKTVSNTMQTMPNSASNQVQANSETMTSTMINNNSNSKSVSPILDSLAKASEPIGFSFKQQPATVASFPQRTPGESPPANTRSPFGTMISQNTSPESAAAFNCSNTSSSSNPAPFTFHSPPNNSTAGFSFDNKSNQSFQFNQKFDTSQLQQPLPSFTFTPSKQKQNETLSESLSTTFSTTSQIKAATAAAAYDNATGNTSATISEKKSDPPTPISQQSSQVNQEREDVDVPASLADESLVAKKLNTKLRDSHDLVVDRSDPNSPLYSLKSFEDLQLKPDLLRGIYNMNFQSPSKIQEIALPILLGNPPKNIIAQSQSGTGKTGAFSLAIISRIDPSIQSPQALILAPTFELAVQIGSVIEQMAQFLPYIQIAYAIRDSHLVKKTNVIRGQSLTEPIVIGTPGTVEDWCRRRRAFDLSKLRMFCIDEADVMIDTASFQQTCIDLVKSVNMSQCQMMLFSATYSDDVMKFARETVPTPTVLRLKREKQTLKNIRQYFIRCYDHEQKYAAIEQIYASLTVGQAMIFCRTKATARELAVRMANTNHSVRELTGALNIEQRAAVMANFREGLCRVLISTNVTSRGIDIDDVSLVINYDMPVNTKYEPDFETYLHRIGRCGRFGKLGHTFNLIGSEKDLHVKEAIEAYFQHPIDELAIDSIATLNQDEE